MKFVKIEKSTSEELAKLVQDLAFYRDKAATAIAQTASTQIQPAEAVIIAREAKVWQRYATNVGREIEDKLSSLTEAILFATSNIDELSDDEGILYASIEDEVQAEFADAFHRAANEADQAATLKAESMPSRTLDLLHQERIELHLDEHEEFSFKMKCMLQERFLDAFCFATPKSELQA